MLYGQGPSDTNAGLVLGVISTITGGLAIAAAATGAGAPAAGLLEGISIASGLGAAGVDCAKARDLQCGLDTVAAGLGVVGGVAHVAGLLNDATEAGVEAVNAAKSVVNVTKAVPSVSSPAELLDMLFGYNATGFGLVGSVFDVAQAVRGGDGGGG